MRKLLAPVRLLLVSLLLSVLTTRAASPDPIPPAILNDSTMMVLYHTGRASAIADAELALETGAELPLFRTMYQVNLSLLVHLRRFGSLWAEAYMLGRMHVYWELADRAGEPSI